MTTLTIIQVVVAVLLIAVILLQNRSAGVGGLFGGGGASNAFSAKRGLEKMLFRATVGLAIAFLLLALLQLA